MHQQDQNINIQKQHQNNVNTSIEQDIENLKIKQDIENLTQIKTNIMQQQYLKSVRCLANYIEQLEINQNNESQSFIMKLKPEDYVQNIQIQSLDAHWNNQYQEDDDNHKEYVDACIKYCRDNLRLETNDVKRQALLGYLIKYYINVQNGKLQKLDQYFIDNIITECDRATYPDNFIFLMLKYTASNFYNMEYIYCFYSHSKTTNRIKLNAVTKAQYIAKGHTKKVYAATKVNKDKHKNSIIILFPVSEENTLKNTLCHNQELMALERQNKMIDLYPELHKYFIKTKGISPVDKPKCYFFGIQKNVGLSVKRLMKEQLLTVYDCEQILRQQIELSLMINKYDLYLEDVKPANMAYEPKTKNCMPLTLFLLMYYNTIRFLVTCLYIIVTILILVDLVRIMIIY